MEKLSNDLFGNFEKYQIENLNMVIGGANEEGVETILENEPGFCKDIDYKEGTVYIPCE